MKRIATGLLAITLLAIFCPVVLAAEGVPAQVVDSRKQIYRVYNEFRKNYFSLGTGFVIATDDDNTYVITNYHVVEDARNDKVEIAMYDGFMLSAEILAYEEDHDICILKTEEPIVDAVPFILADEDKLRLGDMVYALGFPGAADYFLNDLAYHYDDLTITQGVLSSFKRCILNENKRTLLLQTDTPINPGNSGGPLLNDRGEVLGIVSYGVLESQGVNAAVSAQHLMELLEENEVAYTSAADIVKDEAVVNALLAPPAVQSAPNIPVVAVSAQDVWGASYSNLGWLAFACIAGCVLLAGSLGIRAYLRRQTAAPAAQNLTAERYKAGLQEEAEKYAEGLQGGPAFPLNHDKKEPPAVSKLPAMRGKKGAGLVLYGILAALVVAAVYVSAHMYLSERYTNAVVYIEAEAYGPASEALSGAWAASYRDSMSLRRYAAAGQALQNGEYDTAKELFQGLGAYRNAPEMALACIYRSAELLRCGGQIQEAYALYQTLNTYADSADKQRECAYQMALDKTARFLETGELADAQDALDSLAKLTGYGDADARLEALQQKLYDTALEKTEKIFLWLRIYQLHFLDKIQNTAREITEIYALLPSYRDCDELQPVMEALQQVADVASSYDALLQYWDVPVANKILLSNYYLGWHLRGRWAGSGKYFYHAADADELLASYTEGYPYYGAANFMRKIPNTGAVDQDVFGVFCDIPVISGKNYFIENRRLYTGARKGFWRMWKESYAFTFTDADTIVITDKDDKEYTLKRAD